jgi:hypothetical protein
MKTTSLIGLILYTMLTAVVVFSQTDAQPAKKQKKFTGSNFSGTWILDESRSRDIETKVLKLPPPASDPKRKVTNILFIEQKDFEVKVTFKRRKDIYDDSGKLVNSDEQVQAQSTFYGDKRGEKNKFNTEKLYDSETEQKGKEIVISIAVDDKRHLYNLLTFTLSKDGSELTYDNSGYKIEPDYTTGSSYVSPTELRSKKVYIKAK